MASVIVSGDTSGTITIAAPAVAGSGTLTLPVATDTLVGKATTDTLTNKTLVAPALGTPASGVLTNCTGVVAGALPAGSVLQVKNFQTGAVATGTTLIPFDDTIPQITEGTQFLSLAITPISATSKLYFNIALINSPSIIDWVITALFQDATANAIASTMQYGSVAMASAPGIFTYFMTSGTTSSTTFTVRAGMRLAGTTTINGQAGGRLLGGTLISSITITEIAA
jgi:hypothetical protein